MKQIGETMNTNINPDRTAIDWDDLVNLCESCGLSLKGPSKSKRYSFWFQNKQLIHQVQKYGADQFRTTGYFSGKFGEQDWNGQPVTSSGKIRVIETIDPNAKMTRESQPVFSKILLYVANRR